MTVAATLLRQFLVEWRACCSPAGSVAVAQWALQTMLQLVPQAMPRIAETTIDAKVFAFALTMSVVTALLFGFAPAVAL